MPLLLRGGVLRSSLLFCNQCRLLLPIIFFLLCSSLLNRRLRGGLAFTILPPSPHAACFCCCVCCPGMGTACSCAAVLVA